MYSKRKERRNVRCEQHGLTDGHSVQRGDTGMYAAERTNWTVDRLLVGLGLLVLHPRHRKFLHPKVNPLTNSGDRCSGLWLLFCWMAVWCVYGVISVEC